MTKTPFHIDPQVPTYVKKFEFTTKEDSLNNTFLHLMLIHNEDFPTTTGKFTIAQDFWGDMYFIRTTEHSAAGSGFSPANLDFDQDDDSRGPRIYHLVVIGEMYGQVATELVWDMWFNSCGIDTYIRKLIQPFDRLGDGIFPM
jgi:hypothetical protein